MKEKTKKTLWAIIFTLILMFAIYSIMFYSNREENNSSDCLNNSSDEGKYDYCVEWEGLGGGTLHRDSLLYTCYNLATSTFFCDYEINKATQVLEIKPIINITKNEEGFITEIIYDEPNYFNCIKWLKSRR